MIVDAEGTSCRDDVAPDLPFISVVICTRERAASLKRGLQSMCQLNIPKGLKWELLVIDNGGSDETRLCCLGFLSKLPLRYFDEPRAGLSFARNRAISEVKGAYICWTDDDTLVEPEWLKAYAEAFVQHPNASVFGGKIIPLLMQPAPEWFSAHMHQWPVSNVVAARDLGDEVTPISPENDGMPWGANYAVRALEQRLNCYDTELGLSPNRRRIGEESDVLYRIIEGGGKGWWVPTCRLHHCIPNSRQTLRHFYRHFYGAGQTEAYQHSVAVGPSWFEANRPSRILKVTTTRLALRAGKHLFKFAVPWFSGRRFEAIRDWARFAYYCGALSFRFEERTRVHRHLSNKTSDMG